jgi:hypothetical protein
MGGGCSLALRCVLPADRQRKESVLTWTIVLIIKTDPIEQIVDRKTKSLGLSADVHAQVSLRTWLSSVYVSLAGRISFLNKQGGLGSHRKALKLSFLFQAVSGKILHQGFIWMKTCSRNAFYPEVFMLLPHNKNIYTPFRRHFLGLFCHSIRWLWHSCD